VIDASTAITLVIENPLSDQVKTLWQGWVTEGRQVCAPGLWLNEVTSVIHKIAKLTPLDDDGAVRILEAVLALGVEVFPEDAALCRQAFEWATRLDQLAAYDGFYLALGEKLGGTFWSADQRLVNRAQQLGLSWVRSVEDS
jgi:predicted nucleic acid-binding protein